MTHRRIFGVGMVVVLFAAAAIGYRTFEKPHIDSIGPGAFGPGEAVKISGKNFGANRGESDVFLDGVPLMKTAYLSWSDNEIVIKAPQSLDSGTLRVETAFGASNADIIINSGSLPQKPDNSSNVSSGPVIYSINPLEASVGSLVEIDGINFGSNLQFSAVRFSGIAQGIPSDSGLGVEDNSNRAPNLPFIEPDAAESMYEGWDDKKILVRVPEGAGTGAVFVHTPQGDSNPFFLRMKKGSGTKYLYDPAVYSIQLKVSIRKTSSQPGGNITVYMPTPVSSGSQRLDSIQEESPAPFMEDFGGLTVFRLENVNESEVIVRRSALVTVYNVDSSLDSFKDTFAAASVPAFLQAYLKDDGLVPAKAKEIQALSSKVIGKEKNLQKKASLLWDWLKKNVEWKSSAAKPAKPTGSALAAFRERQAGSEDYALVACALFRAAGIPSVPLSGFLIRKDGVSIPHFWLEYYLPSVGWVPFDPVLALGVRPSGFDAGLDDPLHYFGSLDNRHIAISRGTKSASPLFGGSAKRSDKVAWSFQTVFEESNDMRYNSTWYDMEVLGEY